MTDICFSLDALVQSYPPAAEVIHSSSFEPRLASFYQQVLAPLFRYVARQREAGFVGKDLAEKLLSRLQVREGESE